MGIQTITTVDKNFYAGMTRDDAEKKGLMTKRSLWQFDKSKETTFWDLDMNKDGILDDYEICRNRDEKADSERQIAFSAGICIPIWVLSNIGKAKKGPLPKLNKFMLPFITISGIAACINYLLISDETRKYRKAIIQQAEAEKQTLPQEENAKSTKKITETQKVDEEKSKSSKCYYS